MLLFSVNLERSAGEVEQVVRQQCPLEMAYCLDKAFNLLSYRLRKLSSPHLGCYLVLILTKRTLSAAANYDERKFHNLEFTTLLSGQIIWGL